MPRKILIVGGGAGGLELAIRLARRPARGDFAVTLVDRNATHIWKPRLHELATGLLVGAEEEASYADLGHRHGFAFSLGAMTAMDPARRTIDLADVPWPARAGGGDAQPMIAARTLGYDTAVLAVGSTVNDFGTPGVAEHCFTLDTQADAEALNRALVAVAARVAAAQAAMLRVVVVGAGQTGVEFAAELSFAVRDDLRYRSLIAPAQVAITVVEMADRPLAGLDPGMSDAAARALERRGIALRLRSKVDRVEPGFVHIAGGDVLAADIVLWASGIRGRDVARAVPGTVAERGGRLRVDAMLRAVSPEGVPLDGLYCIGDCAAFHMPGEPQALGATAQAAQQQARLLARSLLVQARGGAALAFRYRDRGTLVTFGGDLAAGQVKPFGRSRLIGGWTASVAYAALYRAHLAVLFGWRRTIAFTLARLLRRSAMPSFKLEWR